MKRLNLGIAVATALLATACVPKSKRPAYGDIQREALAGVDDPVPATLPLTSDSRSAAEVSVTQREISHGTGRFIRPQPLEEPRPAPTGKAAVTLNFEDQPVEAVVKAILGDLLDANYSLAPG